LPICTAQKTCVLSEFIIDNRLWTPGIMLSNYNMTGFGKTVLVHTRIEIQFIAYYNSHTQALSRHSNTIAI